MSNYQHETNEYMGGGPLDELKKKRMTKPRPTFMVRLKKGQVKKRESTGIVPPYLEDDETPIGKKGRLSKDEEDEGEREGQEEIEEIQEIEDDEGNAITSLTRTTIKFSDKRKSLHVNRDLILNRLHKHTNIRVVENGRVVGKSLQEDVFKIPMVNQQPSVNQKQPMVNQPPPEFVPHKKQPPQKLKSTLTIQERMGEEMEKGFEELEEELPDVIETEQQGDNEEREPIGELEEMEIEAEPAVITFKPKRKANKSKKGEEEKEEEQEKKGEKGHQGEEVEEGEEGEKEGQKVKGKKRTTRKVYEEFQFAQEPIGKDVKIGKKTVISRLPKREKFVVRASNYYMNNRKLYTSKIAELFRPYRKEILDQSKKASCELTGKVNFQLLTHQKIVRDYLNLYTPYRGLLLYHGLGSGKTCTSIAIAEGMKTHRQIVLMTPASLKMNFFSQLKECGDLMYRKNQYWEFISIDGKPDYINILSNVLQIPTEMIQRKKGAWLVDITKKESNFSDLTNEQRVSIDEQLDLMIRSKYLDINYNGLNTNKLNELTNNKTENPFDNKTVIIDEAHNFVSRIVNKVNAPSSISYVLYDYLMKATNCKIVLLSGTPIINYPNELGILFNILRGYIKRWTFQLRIRSTAPASFKVNKEEIMKMFDREDFNTYDYVEYSGNKLYITRNPFGFINTSKHTSKRGGDTGLFGGKLTNIFGGRKTRKPIVIRASTKKTVKNRHSSKKEKKPHFIVEDGMVKETKVGIKEEEDEPILKEEETTEYNQRIFPDIHKDGPVGGGVFEDYNGITLDETGNISDEDFVREIKRILQKNYLEIVEVGSDYEELKSLPDNSDSFNSLFIDFDSVKMKNENTFKKRILGLTSYFRSAEESLLPSFVKTETGENYHIVPVEMSEYQFNYYAKVRKEEADKEKQKQRAAKKGKQGKKDDELFAISSSYRIFSRAACNFAFPNPPGRPMPNKGDKEVEDNGEQLSEHDVDAIYNEEILQRDDYAGIEDVESLKEPPDYPRRIAAALKQMKYDPSKDPDEQFLTEDKLSMYSPKFLKILENIQSEENRGLHLLYSQFRTIEGIGILKLILEANGFAEFKISKKDSTDTWEMVENEGDEGKPRFVLYTGTETPEEKEIIRNIYNSVWETVPVSITNKLREISSNNHYGEIIKLMMITASGAEGINLRNTRFVHIVEPYWHMVRTEQVIGRARRICSHQDLPEEYRTVKVFLYLSVFSEEQKTNKKNIELMNRDTSRIDNRAITTDESLFDTAIIKSRINTQLLDAVKETAIDCALFNPLNKEENLVCYGFGKVESNAFASYPTLDQDLGEIEETNAKKARIQLKETKPIDGVVYAINPRTLELYDLESYRESLAGTGELIRVGKAVKTGRGQFRIDKV